MARALVPMGVASRAVVGSGQTGRVRVGRALLARRWDVVVFQKVLPGRALLYLACRRSRVVVFECDDALNLGYPGAGPREVRRLHGKLTRVLASADVVTTSNPLLAEELRPARGDVVWFPGPAPDPAHRDGCARERLVVWLGSPSTEGHLKLLDDLPRRLNERGWACVAVGAGDVASGLGWDVVPWSEETSRRILARATIGVMPQAASPWDDRKAAYKLLQYAAAGVLPLASDVLPARVLLNSAGLGDLLVAPDGEWSDVVDAAVERREEYAPRLAALISHYSYATAASTWLEAIERAIDDHKDGAMTCG